MASKKKSPVWNYFVLTEDNKATKCNKCEETLPYKLSNTSVMLKHLNRKHNIDAKAISECFVN